jgi:hypothetical protein
MELSSTSTRCVNLHKDDKIFCFFFQLTHTHRNKKRIVSNTEENNDRFFWFFFFLFSDRFNSLSLPDFFLFVCLNVWAWLPKTAPPPISLSTQQINQPKFEKKKKNKIVIYKKRWWFHNHSVSDLCDMMDGKENENKIKNKFKKKKKVKFFFFEFEFSGVGVKVIKGTSVLCVCYIFVF